LANTEDDSTNECAVFCNCGVGIIDVADGAMLCDTLKDWVTWESENTDEFEADK
jgi:hypothetical protein